MIKFDNRPLAKRPRMGFDNRLRALVPTLAQQIAAIMAGKVGVWFDASDLSTMYQDAAGTIPVTGVGQPVGLWKDKSGNNYHAFQKTAAKRPTLRQDENGKYYLKADGVDDAMVTNVIPWSGNSIVVSSAISQIALVSAIAETSANSNTGGNCFYLGGKDSGGFIHSKMCSFTAASTESRTGLSTPYVLTNASNKGTLTIRNALTNQSTNYSYTGSLVPNNLFIMARNQSSLYLNGAMYGLIVLNDTYSNANRILIEKYLAQQSGVTLP